MAPGDENTSYYDFRQTGPSEWQLDLQGALGMGAAEAVVEPLCRRIRKRKPRRLVVDISRLDHADDYGALILIEIRRAVIDAGGEFHLAGNGDHRDRLLKMMDFDAREPCTPIGRKRSGRLVIRLGEATIDALMDIRFMVAFVGSVFIALMSAIRHPGSVRYGDILLYMERTGVNAVPIVGLISFLLGLVMAFMSSLQLEQFGANVYVASLVSLAMVSELGPIMTAIVVAGRSGSAFAAEIGTMKISEEIDALVTMGFDPALFLAIPRIVAAVVVIPLLTLFSDLFAIAGGLFVGVFILDLTPTVYIAQTLKTLTLFEVMWGLSKSVVFAFLIAWVGCLRGFQTRGGADAVGNAATSAVVTSVFLIILSDSIFAILRSYW